MRQDNMAKERKKPSEYGIQLREKQKARIYRVLERQFANYFELAERKGITGENLQILERRLDNTVYRLGFATSRKREDN